MAVLGVIAGSSPARAAGPPAPPADSRVSRGKPGPWGDLEFTRIAIEPPVEYLDLATSTTFERGRWVFRDLGRAQVEELFRSASLSTPQFEKLLRATPWTDFPGGVVVQPDRDFILALEPPSRRAIYSVLARWQENEAQTGVFVFRPELLNERLEGSGLRETTLAGFKRLLYPQGALLAFADSDPFMTSLGDDAEKRRFFRTISRRITVLAKLRITPATDIDTLAEYWDYPGRPKDLRPLFESLSRIPEGAGIDLVHLLPPFARKRIYTFPAPSEDPLAAMRNCHWTAFNFFNDGPDDRYCDPQVIQQTAFTEYDQVEFSAERKFGDLFVLFDAAGESLHSAVYLADDLVFTKNGPFSSQPWCYMRLQDMMDSYGASPNPESAPRLMVLRRKQNRPPAPAAP